MTPELETTYLLHEIDGLRRENTYLRNRLHDSNRHRKRIELAYEDALLMAGWRVAGIIPSRRYARLHQITQRRWQNAVALLRMARVITRPRAWSTDAMAVIEKRLEQAKTKALNDQELFFLRLNRHGRR